MFRNSNIKLPNGDLGVTNVRRPGPQRLDAKTPALLAKQEWWSDNTLKAPAIDLILYESEKGEEWTEIARETFTLKSWLQGMSTVVIERNVDPNKIIRFSVFTNFFKVPKHDNDKDSPIALRLHDAKLFGAQCYPDFANSEGCLGSEKKGANRR